MPDIEYVEIPYDDFVEGEVVASVKFNSNNAAIGSKTNEIIAETNFLVEGSAWVGLNLPYVVIEPNEELVIGDGVTNDTMAIQLMINTTKTVFVRKGLYLIDGLNISSDTKIYGEVGARFLMNASSFDGIYLTIASGVEIFDCEFYLSNGTSPSGTFIYASTAEDVIIDNCTFQLASEGIFGDSCENLLINNCVFNSCNYGVNLSSCSNVVIEDNKFDGCSNPINFLNGTYLNCSTNHLTGVKGIGIRVFTSLPLYATVQDNKLFSDVDSNTTGIFVNGGPANILHNHIEGFTANGMTCSNGQQVRVDGNYISTVQFGSLSETLNIQTSRNSSFVNNRIFQEGLSNSRVVVELSVATSTSADEWNEFANNMIVLEDEPVVGGELGFLNAVIRTYQFGSTRIVGNRIRTNYYPNAILARTKCHIEDNFMQVLNPGEYTPSIDVDCAVNIVQVGTDIRVLNNIIEGYAVSIRDYRKSGATYSNSCRNRIIGNRVDSTINIHSDVEVNYLGVVSGNYNTVDMSVVNQNFIAV